MRAWRYDFVMTDTGDLPMIELRVDVPTMERLTELLENLPDGAELRASLTEPREML